MARITRLAPPSGRLWHLAVAAAALILGGAADRIDFPAETPAAKTQASKKQTSPQPPSSIARPGTGGDPGRTAGPIPSREQNQRPVSVSDAG